MQVTTGLCQTEAKRKEFYLVPPWVAGTQILELSSLLPRVHMGTKPDRKEVQGDFNLGSLIWGAGIPNSG